MSASVSFDGDLPRRGVFGLRFAPAREGDDARVPGALIEACSPNGAAERAGVRAGERLLSAHGVLVRDAAHARALLTASRAGQTRTLTLASPDASSREVSVTANPAPTEMHEGLAVRYGVVRADDGARLRTIAVHPASPGKFPAIAMIAGYRPDSTERPGATHDPWRALATELARAGFYVHRLERRGLGDSEGGPPDAADFLQEHSDERASLEALFARPEVDPSRVSLFGYSLGGLHAPLLASREPRVRAVVLFGAGIDTWPEYLCAQLRRYGALSGISAPELERLVRAQLVLNAELFTRGVPLPEVLRTKPALVRDARYLGITSERALLGRDYRYWQQVADAECAGPLVRMRAPVLAVWGSSDWLSSHDEHARIADLVDQTRPGEGDLLVLDRVEHGLRSCDSFADSFAGKTGPLDRAVPAAIDAWLRVRTGPA